LAHFVYLSCYENAIYPNRGILRTCRNNTPEPCISKNFFLFQDFFLLAKYPPPAQKKRYVYMFQSGIMNYKG
jgi:hypothetical protein